MIVCKTLFYLSIAFLQLASDPEADELLVQTLVNIEDLDQSFCSRFAGTLSSIQNGAPREIRIAGIAARNENGIQFHTYGTQSMSGEGELCWYDALRDTRDVRKRFKMGYAEQLARSRTDLDVEKESDPNSTWIWPEINPFGIVFGSESRMQRRYSDFRTVREDLTRKFELERSRVLKNGNTENTEGSWLSIPDKKIRLTVEFDRNQQNMPVVVKTELTEKNLVVSLAKTTWTKYENALVPETISISCEREDGYIVQIEFKWEWVPLKRWQSWSDKNVEGLFSKEVNDIRAQFSGLFVVEKEKG